MEKFKQFSEALRIKLPVKGVMPDPISKKEILDAENEAFSAIGNLRKALLIATGGYNSNGNYLSSDMEKLKKTIDAMWTQVDVITKNAKNVK